MIYYTHNFDCDGPNNKVKCRYCDVKLTYDELMRHGRRGIHSYLKSCISDEEKIIKDIIE